MERLVSRRAVLARGLAVVSGLAAALGARLGRAAAASTLPAYRLVPGAGCATCRACRAHAAHKLFASAAAADARRAHPGCKCQVAVVPLPVATWRALFGPPSAPVRTHVDRRQPEIGHLLPPGALPARSAPTRVGSADRPRGGG